MSWRIVEITQGNKLDLQLGYLVIRGSETKKIHISEIAVLIIESTAVSLTAALLCELTKQKVKVIFCDEKRYPQTELVPYYGAHDTSRKVQKQAKWSEEIMGDVWTRIIANKIRKQMMFLQDLKKQREADLLECYLADMKWNDESNREGHAAKVYFNALFGMDFSRSGENAINTALNYGYSLMLTAVSREITAYGCITQLGIHHCNAFNYFNLASDIMESFRILVDRKVVDMKPAKITKNEKLQLVSLLNESVLICGQKQTVLNAIRIYVKSVLDALCNGDPEIIRFYSFIK